MPPYNRTEAEYLRETGEQIVACFQCLVEERDYPYWPFQAIEFGGAMAYCPEHFKSVSLGDAVIGS